MTTVLDLINAGVDAMVPAPVGSTVVEGTDWRATWYVTDTDGMPVDMSGATYDCEVRDTIGGEVLVTPTVTGYSDGRLSLSATAADTAGIVPAGAGESINAVWQCLVTSGGLIGVVWSVTSLQLIAQTGA